MKFKAFIAGAVFLGVALGTAAPALAGYGPVITPALCGHHEEYAYISHTKGNIYVTACAVGRGDGGPHT